MKTMKKELTEKQSEELMGLLKTRFEKNMNRHKGMKWTDVQKKLEKNAAKLWSLNEMERSGGEPDVVVFDKKSKEIVFCDCSAESPAGRRSFCYDEAALKSRKEHKPKNNAVGFAKEIGIEILTEEEYMLLQQLGTFDQKTQNWIKTPDAIRKQGGALFCDPRYGRVFIGANGAESYFAGRGFRGKLII